MTRGGFVNQCWEFRLQASLLSSVVQGPDHALIDEDVLVGILIDMCLCEGQALHSPSFFSLRAAPGFCWPSLPSHAHSLHCLPHCGPIHRNPLLCQRIGHRFAVVRFALTHHDQKIFSGICLGRELLNRNLFTLHLDVEGTNCPQGADRRVEGSREITPRINVLKRGDVSANEIPCVKVWKSLEAETWQSVRSQFFGVSTPFYPLGDAGGRLSIE